MKNTHIISLRGSEIDPALPMLLSTSIRFIKRNFESLDITICYQLPEDFTLQDSIKHFKQCYYQKKKLVTSRISYIRWAQSWMFYAFSFYLLEASENE